MTTTANLVAPEYFSGGVRTTVGGQPIAVPTDRLYRLAAERRIDAPAEVTDVDLDQVVVATDFRVPYGGEDVGFGPDLPLCRMRSSRTANSLGVKPTGIAAMDGMCGRVEMEVAGGQDRRTFGRPLRARARSRAISTTTENGLVR